MLRLKRMGTRRRWVSAVMAAAWYLASAVVVPVVHARTEVLSSVSEVEPGHSAECPRIHTEASCLVCGSFQVPSPPPRALPGAQADRPSAIGGPRETLAIQQDRTNPHLVRAPPAR
jgi:hypothetical protein